MTSLPLPVSAFDLSRTDIDVSGVLQGLTDQAEAGRRTAIGFPGAVDIDFTPMSPMFSQLFNNVGDPSTPPGGTAHTKQLERAVIDWCAELLGLPPADRWGYVTAGGTEGNLAAVHAAHHRYPDAVVYYSRAAHYSIPKIVDILGVDSAVINADERGVLDYAHLDALVSLYRDRPAIVIATAGTTMTEAIDDTGRIQDILRSHGLSRRHVHVDGALAGIPLAFEGLLSFDSSVDSVAISGHKFFGTPIPCGVVLIRDSARRAGRQVAYTATLDTTVSGSRCGQAAALLWYAIATHGREGHRIRAHRARELASYTTDRLTAVGWPAWRHPQAFTVVLRTPPVAVTSKWLLATEGQWSHVICMPGISYAQMDAFVADVARAAAGPSLLRPQQWDDRRREAVEWPAR